MNVRCQLGNDAVLTVQIPSAGLHTFKLWLKRAYSDQDRAAEATCTADGNSVTAVVSGTGMHGSFLYDLKATRDGMTTCIASGVIMWA